MTGYAWKITKDHLAFECEGHYDTDETLLSGVGIGEATYCNGKCNPGETGVTGPSTASAEHLALLKDGEGVTFKMYDDDGELYYTGRLVYDADREGDEEVVGGPLRDFGLPNAGAVRIVYPRKPEWEVYA